MRPDLIDLREGRDSIVTRQAPHSPDCVARRLIMVIYGTRPEAVKLAPIIRELTSNPAFTPVVAVTGQHRSMLDEVNVVFGITPDFDLDVHQPGQTLSQITSLMLCGVQQIIAEVKPDAVVVQGDTTSSFVGALAAFYEQIPVIHVEAGLRTHNRYSPFPEEINRRLTTQLATMHLAPTATNRANLTVENVDPGTVVVTGNTVIDALLWAVGRCTDYGEPTLADLDGTDDPVLLVTVHRRESWGRPIHGVCAAVARIARTHPKTLIVFPMHRNPVIRSAAIPALSNLPNVRLTDPLPYASFARLLNRSTVVLTDSGGIQEEAPSLGKPVLVLRDTTERPEAVASGSVRLVGTDQEQIVREVDILLNDPDAYSAMAQSVNPYGDGHAASRSVAALAHFFGLGAPTSEFVTTGVSRPFNRTPEHMFHSVEPTA